jgi:hypothetical protein
MKKVAFIINFEFRKWLGGYYLIKNLIYCIQKFSNKKIEPVLIVKKNLKRSEFLEFKNFNLIRTNIFTNQSNLIKIINKLKIIFFGKLGLYEDFFYKHKINVLSHINVFSNNIILGKKSSTKTLSLIADFQHLYFPENFPLKQRILRNFNTHLSSNYASKILLISNDAKNDLRKISSKGYKNCVINKFIFPPIPKNKIIQINKLKKKYNFKQNYFFLPNQYWVHKNHIVVLKALKSLSQNNKYKKILILSTGSNDDQKGFDNFKKLNEFIKINKLENNYKYLGIVPYEDLMSLMFHSIAVLNPSKFEGRSSTVEQAKSIGKKIILTKINIHLEQKPKRSIYFKIDDHKELSRILFKESLNFKKSKDIKFIDKAYSESDKNLKNYYKEFENIIFNLLK